MVAQNWLLMSSPTMGKPASRNFWAHSDFLGQWGVRGEKVGPGIPLRGAARQTGFGVMLNCLFRADGQVAQQHLGARLAQSFSDIGRLQVRRAKRDVVVIVLHMRR